jgi:hypothetical protein
MKPLPLAVAFATAATFALAAPSIAHACGACFSPPDTPTVVSGHRMVMSISGQQTVLWDQIQYQGEPEDFAWVLPVKPGARIETATDAFFEALEATTRTRVTGQPVNCGGGFGGDGDGDGCSPGCSAASYDEADDGGSGGASGGAPPPPVEVVHQGSVGPYETVTLSTMVPGALNAWLTDHGYNVDPTSQPIIDQYVSEGFDFIALRLAPGLGVKQMKPVRVVMEGGGLTLPLRMVAIGTGAQTPIVLYLIGEGRYTLDNLTSVNVRTSDLVWDYATSTSNYETLRTEALAQNGGRSFLTSFAADAFFYTPITTTTPTGGVQSQTFLQLYAEAAKTNGEVSSCLLSKNAGAGYVSDPCPGQEFDSAECTSTGSPGNDARNFGCPGAYDVSRALVGTYPNDVWVTRTEMILPREALAADLTIRAASQAGVSAQLTAEKSLNADKACEGFASAVPVWNRLTPPGRPMRAAPLIALSAALALFLRRVLRTKRWARAAA